MPLHSNVELAELLLLNQLDRPEASKHAKQKYEHAKEKLQNASAMAIVSYLAVDAVIPLVHSPS